MLRSKHPFPLPTSDSLFYFLEKAWNEGWFDEYSNEHFLIQAIEKRLIRFVGMQQHINNTAGFSLFTDGNMIVNPQQFCFNFCMNFSAKMQIFLQKFGEKQTKSFICNQMSAGKSRYDEDSFFEALSEVSILLFYLSRTNWTQVLYEPPVSQNGSAKNPEASFIGKLCCSKNSKDVQIEKVKINIEVKSPRFPHDNHEQEQLTIPTILLTQEGRVAIKELCCSHNFKYLDPRVQKLKDYLNSAAEKFCFPGTNELNLLYINWSYRDFPSDSFLEAWSLLTNPINGVLTHPDIARKLGIVNDVFKKITAVVVYTQPLDAIVFSDFRYIWTRGNAGPKFRMWVLNEEIKNTPNLLFRITGMNPSPELLQYAMVSGSNLTEGSEVKRSMYIKHLSSLIEQHSLV